MSKYVWLLCSKNFSNYSFCWKKALNIDGFGEKQVKQFYDLKLIKDVSDIFNIQNHRLEIESLEGWGELSFNNLVNSIENLKLLI